MSCGFGLCCFDGSKLCNQDAEMCNAFGGTWHDCNPCEDCCEQEECPEPCDDVNIKPCCYTNNNDQNFCFEKTECDCNDLNGTWMENEDECCPTSGSPACNQNCDCDGGACCSFVTGDCNPSADYTCPSSANIRLIDCCSNCEVSGLGACCYSGSCQNDISKVECEHNPYVQGIWWDGMDCGEVDCNGCTQQSDCPGQCCVNGTCEPCDADTGACCEYTTMGGGSWQCSEVSQQDCDGEYRGDGTDCTTVDCGGACCYPDLGWGWDCFDNDYQSNCGGIWQGDGTDCATSHCECTVCRACCIGGTCSIEESYEDCTSLGGVWFNNETDCSTANLCNLGACCTSTECTVITNSECNEISGTWHSDITSCDLNPCDLGTACCIDCASANCINTQTSGECEAQGGVWNNSERCEDASVNYCQNTGVCCNPDGSCDELEWNDTNPNTPESHCENIVGGIWHVCQTCQDVGCQCGMGGFYCPEQECCINDSCEPCSVEVGACCHTKSGIETCQEITQTECELLSNYIYYGDLTTCAVDGASCGTGNGACCLNTGCEDNYSEAICLGEGGEYYGDGSTCASSTQCESQSWGNCCKNCKCITYENQTVCETDGGIWYGLDPCPNDCYSGCTSCVTCPGGYSYSDSDSDLDSDSDSDSDSEYKHVKLPSGECVWMQCTPPSCPYPECRGEG